MAKNIKLTATTSIGIPGIGIFLNGTSEKRKRKL
jgi:hypothetical protein